ncbi:MaoC family dehydratase [Candidatus Entotheonella palauensis]|nr:MaoC family dehydratase [Candidatus Entotheonella palauensis]
MADDVYVGKELGTAELTITDEMVQHYINGLDEPNAWYTSDSPFGGPVAPAIIFQDISSRFKGWYLPNLYGNLWRQQSWEVHAPVRVGQTLSCNATVSDRYRKRDRDVVVQSVWLHDAEGRLVALGMHHQSFL